MAAPNPGIAFVLEEFALRSPGQQLLDRFLAGYPREGAFHRPPFQVAVYAGNRDAVQGDLAAREKAFGLRYFAELPDVLGQSQAVIIAGARPLMAISPLLRRVIESAQTGANCFIYGSAGTNLAQAKALMDLAAQKKLNLRAGTTWPWCWRLPDFSYPASDRLREALVVVQGDGLDPVLDGIEVLSPILEPGRAGQSPLAVRRVKYLAGEQVWTAQTNKEWSTDLLAAAISRSNTPQGDPFLDGRTQDLVGLGLVPKLASQPRAWLIEYRADLRSAILVLNGAVKDCNFALRIRNGKIWSAQVYRPPLPTAPEFSRLAAVLEDFFLTGQFPGAVARALSTAAALERCAEAVSHPNQWLDGWIERG